MPYDLVLPAHLIGIEARRCDGVVYGSGFFLRRATARSSERAWIETPNRRATAAVWSCPIYAELSIDGAMRSSGLCGVGSAAPVDAGHRVERYSA